LFDGNNYWFIIKITQWDESDEVYTNTLTFKTKI